MKIKSKKFIIFVIVIYLFFLAFIKLFLDGYRLTPSSAAHCVRFTEPIQQELLLEEQISSDLVFYLLDTGDSYHTIYSSHVGPLWKAYYGVGSNRSKEDNIIELQTKYWLTDAEIGWIIAVSHDPNVASFQVVCDNLTIEEAAVKDTPTIIVVPAPSSRLSNMGTGFDAFALSEDGTPLYTLAYPIENYTVHTNEYDWYPIKNDINFDLLYIS